MSKGFTLIELLITIALMAMISVSIGISVSSMLNRQDEEDIEIYETRIKQAACTYAGIAETGNTTLTFDKLISEGYLSKTLRNPRTTKTVYETKDTESVKVQLIDGQYICTYSVNK